MESFALYVTVSSNQVTLLSNSRSQLNLAIQVSASDGTRGYQNIRQQDVAGHIDLSWDVFQIVGIPDYPTKITPQMRPIKCQERYVLAEDGTTTIVPAAPDCPINAFEFSPAVSAKAQVYLNFQSQLIPYFQTASVTSTITITPIEQYKIWFSDTDGNNKTQELTLDYTGLRSVIASYSDSGWALTAPSSYNFGGIFGISKTDQGYIVTQEAKSPTLPPVNGVDSRFALDWSFGPLTLEGYIDTNMEIGFLIKVLGIDLGHFFGNLNEGLVVKLNLFLVRGTIKLYLVNLTEVWVNVDLDVAGSGEIKVNKEIWSLPLES